jgi:hypothetical protein
VADFDIVDVPTFLNLRVTTVGADGKEIPDDGELQRRGAEMQYLLAEFLHQKGFLVAGVDVSRRPDLTIKFSLLTEQGQAFVKFAVPKWMKSLDRASFAKPVDASGLERRWRKFVAT